ncbi:aquaporin [Pseudoduganella sp. S-14]|jgi:glycerol uptake facilitator-like aquaporin|uniref:aquaporin n=1 Tax=Pseudoduganella sp. S-14 TaxID=3404065 RepID=UPI003CF8C7E4
MTLARRLAAEGLGTALLLAMVVGSAIMADRLAGGNAAIALFANSVASAAGLLALILAFGAISGAHFNPVVTLSEAWQGGMEWSDTLPYVAAQVFGAFAGIAAAHAMFGEPLFALATHPRGGAALWWSEFMASFGLIFVISGCARSRPALTPFAVAAYIASAYWFTASSSFANPALTLARAATDTGAGIRFADVPGYVAAQLLGAMAATVLATWLHSPAKLREREPDVRRASTN